MNHTQQHLAALSDEQLLAVCKAVQDAVHVDSSPLVQFCNRLWPDQSFNVHMLISIIPYFLQEMVRRQSGESTSKNSPSDAALRSAASIVCSQVVDNLSLDISIADHRTMIDNLLEIHEQGMITINPPE